LRDAWKRGQRSLAVIDDFVEWKKLNEKAKEEQVYAALMAAPLPDEWLKIRKLDKAIDNVKNNSQKLWNPTPDLPTSAKEKAWTFRRGLANAIKSFSNPCAPRLSPEISRSAKPV
jgi:hypothetical protein